RGQQRTLAARTRLPQGLAHLSRSSRLGSSEKRERDVEVLRGDETQPFAVRDELGCLPRGETVDRSGRQEQGAEEPEPLIAFHPSSRSRTVSCTNATTPAAMCVKPARLLAPGRSPGLLEAAGASCGLPRARPRRERRGRLASAAFPRPGPRCRCPRSPDPP